MRPPSRVKEAAHAGRSARPPRCAQLRVVRSGQSRIMSSVHVAASHTRAGPLGTPPFAEKSQAQGAKKKVRERLVRTCCFSKQMKPHAHAVKTLKGRQRVQARRAWFWGAAARASWLACVSAFSRNAHTAIAAAPEQRARARLKLPAAGSRAIANDASCHSRGGGRRRGRRAAAGREPPAPAAQQSSCCPRCPRRRRVRRVRGVTAARCVLKRQFFLMRARRQRIIWVC